jgi:hypothetical protein
VENRIAQSSEKSLPGRSREVQVVLPDHNERLAGYSLAGSGCLMRSSLTLYGTDRFQQLNIWHDSGKFTTVSA